MGVMAFSGEAQRAGQPIIFSAPQTDDTQPAISPSLKPQGSQLSDLTRQYQPSGVSVLNLHTPSYAPTEAPPAFHHRPATDELHAAGTQRLDIVDPGGDFRRRQARKKCFCRRSALTPWARKKSFADGSLPLDRESMGRTGLTNNWQNEDRGNLPWNVTPGAGQKRHD